MRIAVTAAAVCLSIAGVCAAAESQASIRKPTNIPEQSLDAALQLLAKERDLQMIYSYEVVGERRTRGVSGQLTFDEALASLLSGTGLTYRYLDEKTITILSTRPLSSQGPAQDGRRQDGADGEDAKGFWHRLRLAQTESAASKTGDGLRGSDDASGSSAQNAAGGDSDAQEIIVTAQKRAERLLDVPQSVSVLTADDLARRGATQFRDFANTVPGLTFSTQGAGFTNISLRGVTAGTDISRTVGIYVDEVPYGSSTTFSRGYQISLDVGLFDLDRVEVLRGPQGTLYGASTMGGVLKYVTKQPDTGRFGVEAQTGVSSTEGGGVSYNGAAAMNLPLIADKLALRVSGFESHDGGFIDNVTLGKKDVDSSDIYGGRLDLLYTPSEALRIRLTGFAQQVSRDGQTLADYRVGTFPGVPGSLNQGRLFEEPFDQSFRLVSGTIAYDLGPMTITSVSSYQTSRAEFFTDLSPTFVPLLRTLGRSYSAVGVGDDSSTDKFTQEIRLASATGKRLEWVLGGFYTDEKSDYSQAVGLRDLAGQPAPNDILYFIRPSRYEEYAAFGDVTWHFTEKLAVTGGLRYASNRQGFEQTNTGLIAGVSVPTVRSSDNVFTYLANARYRFTDRATGYLRYATGYRPGGPNQGAAFKDPLTGLPLSAPTFDSDELASYEVGFRTETQDRRFSVDVAAYYIDWSDIQISVVRNGIGARANAPGGATINGAELTLSARPTRSFTVTGTYAYQDATLSEANTDLRAAKDARLPNVPHSTATLDTDYVFSQEGLRPTIGATVRHVGERMAVITANSYRLPEYTSIDLRGGITLGSADLQLFVHNLSDERGQLSTFISSGISGITILQPRTYGVLASMKFQ